MSQLSTPRKSKFDSDEDGVQEEVSEFGEIASPYLKHFNHNARFLDKQYGIPREDEGRFMIGNSIVRCDTSDISINARHFKGTHGLWVLLTRKNVNRGVVTTDDLKRYKTTLVDQLSFTGKRTGGNVETSRGLKFREIISKFFPQKRRPRGVELSLRKHWDSY